MFQECEYEISQKGELVAKLENKTREISQMLNNLNKITATPEKKKVDKTSKSQNEKTGNQTLVANSNEASGKTEEESKSKPADVNIVVETAQ